MSACPEQVSAPGDHKPPPEPAGTASTGSGPKALRPADIPLGLLGPLMTHRPARQHAAAGGTPSHPALPRRFPPPSPAVGLPTTGFPILPHPEKALRDGGSWRSPVRLWHHLVSGRETMDYPDEIVAGSRGELIALRH